MDWRLIFGLLFSPIWNATGDGDGNDYFFEVVRPADLRYSFQIRKARFSVKPADQASTLQLVLARPSKLCNVSDVDQVAERNTVWLVERGECSFFHKVQTAEKHGAAIVLISDIEAGDDNFIDITGINSTDRTTIAAFYLPGIDGRHLRRRLMYGEESIWVKIPLNFSMVPLHMVRKPPWVTW